MERQINTLACEECFKIITTKFYLSKVSIYGSNKPPLPWGKEIISGPFMVWIYVLIYVVIFVLLTFKISSTKVLEITTKLICLNLMLKQQ